MEYILDDLFEKEKIEEGIIIFEGDNVIALEEHENGYKCQVKDGKIYNTHIQLNEDETIKEMVCECILGLNGKNCKHMAASIMEIEYQLSQSNIEFDEEEPIEVVSTDFEDHDEELLSIEFETDIDSSKMGKDKVDVIFENYLEEDGSLRSKNVMPFVTDITIFYDQIDALIYRNDLEIAYNIIKHIVYRINHLNVEVLGDQLETLNQEVFVSLMDIIDSDFENDVTSKIFKWIVSVIDEELVGPIKNSLLNIWVNEFIDEEYIREKIKIAETLIKRYESGTAVEKENLVPAWERVKEEHEAMLAEIENDK